MSVVDTGAVDRVVRVVGGVVRGGLGGSADGGLWWLELVLRGCGGLTGRVETSSARSGVS